MDVNDWTLLVTAIAAIAAAISAMTSAISAKAARSAIKQNEELSTAARESEDSQRENTRLLEHATTTLQRSYIALTGGAERLSFPPCSRINWLTAARLIEEYKNTKTRISEPLLLQECLSHEAHWRNQFSLRLEKIGLSVPGYFEQSGPIDSRIELTSAVIVCGFSTWPEEQDDLIKKYKSPMNAVEQIGLSPRWAQLKFHLDLL